MVANSIAPAITILHANKVQAAELWRSIELKLIARIAHTRATVNVARTVPVAVCVIETVENTAIHLELITWVANAMAVRAGGQVAKSIAVAH